MVKVKLKHHVKFADREVTTEGEFEFDRDLLMVQIVNASMAMFKGAHQAGGGE